MRTVKLVLILVLAVLLAMVVLQNTGRVEARFLWVRAEAPVIVLLLVTSAAGFILGVLVSLLSGRDRRRQPPGTR